MTRDTIDRTNIFEHVLFYEFNWCDIRLGIIEITDLKYRYPSVDRPILNGIDVDIKEGEFILLTGPSGCGKTTFCRCLNGLIPKFYNGDIEGNVVILGKNTESTSIVSLAQDVGLIFQNPDNQIFALTVEKDIAFGLENLGIPKDQIVKEIKWASKNTGIDHLHDRATHELSGGQKQRLAIAGILAMHPKIIVMDEPTAFLDPVGAEDIFQVLRTLNREYNITVIIIEHRIDLAVKFVDRIIVFHQGKIMHDGPPVEVLTTESTKLLGVGIPRIIQLAQRIMDHGIHLDSIPTTSDQFYDLISSRLSGKQSSKALPPFDIDEITTEFRHQPAIEVNDISFSYPAGIKALNDVSLTIHHGEYVAIMGENGAGKTTLVKHFNGLLKPDSGKIFYNKEDVSDFSVATLSKKIGLVFQNPDDQLFEESVEKEISFALNNFGFKQSVIDQRVNWALNLLDLEKYRKSSPFNLSGGERKRVAMASVLAWDPDVLVLDEPTVGQDYGQKERLRHFLMQLQTQGKTVVIVTHDVEYVAESQPRIVLMAKGQIVSDGPAKQIFKAKDKLSESSVAQPELARLFSKLSKHGLPDDVIDVDDALGVLLRTLGGSR